MTALTMLEYCRFAYKAYAQSCVYPMDPFYESHGEGFLQTARDRVMVHVHNTLKLDEDTHKFDPVEYNLKRTPNPSEGVVYRGGTGASPYILFQPRRLDSELAFAKGVDIDGEDLEYHALNNATGRKRVCYFQGRTGMTRSHPKAGWASWLGAVVYDPDAQTLVIVFRGSRSGAGGRALGQALLQSKGSPDWVTDMNHLKGVDVDRFDGATLSCGFWFAYESCKKSLESAFYEALNNNTQVKEIYFTGHSLGGALAQCAYIDMVGGNLLSGKGIQRVKDKAEISCYAISAPPIILGEESKAKVESQIKNVNVFHYFVPKDAVHNSSLVKISAASGINAIIGVVTHPFTTPCHLGEEISLKECKVGFPAAHEPEEVRKGLSAAIAKELRMGVGVDPGFWPTFNFDPIRGAVSHEWGGTYGGSLEAALRAALDKSAPTRVAVARAQLWSEIVQGMTKGSYKSLNDTDGEAFEVFDEMCKSLEKGDKVGFKKQRAEFVKSFMGAKSHKASSSVYWLLLQYVTVRQFALNVV